jgi:hypothetical protein
MRLSMLIKKNLNIIQVKISRTGMEQFKGFFQLFRKVSLHTYTLNALS